LFIGMESKMRAEAKAEALPKLRSSNENRNLSDGHGNLRAFEAVLADLRDACAGLVVQGGDLVTAGPPPAEIIDQIRALGGLGVRGIRTRCLVAESLREFAAKTPKLGPLLGRIQRSDSADAFR